MAELGGVDPGADWSATGLADGVVEAGASTGTSMELSSSSSGATLMIPPQVLQRPCLPAHSLPTWIFVWQCWQVMRMCMGAPPLPISNLGRLSCLRTSMLPCRDERSESPDVCRGFFTIVTEEIPAANSRKNSRQLLATNRTKSDCPNQCGSVSMSVPFSLVHGGVSRVNTDRR